MKIRNESKFFIKLNKQFGAVDRTPTSNAYDSTCAFAAMTSQNVCSKKGLDSQTISCKVKLYRALYCTVKITVCSCFVFLIESDKSFLSSTPVLFSVLKLSSDMIITHTCLVSSSSYEMNVILADLLAPLNFFQWASCAS